MNWQAKCDLVDPNESTDAPQRTLLLGLPVKAPLDYLSDLAECTVAECCDGREEICNKHLSGDCCGESNAFSSNSSNCSGGEVDKDLASQGLQSVSVDDLRPLTTSQISTCTLTQNGNSNDEVIVVPDSCCQFKDLKEAHEYPVRLRAVKNESGWCWIMGVTEVSGSENAEPPKDPMTTSLLCLKSKCIHFIDTSMPRILAF